MTFRPFVIQTRNTRFVTQAKDQQPQHYNTGRQSDFSLLHSYSLRGYVALAGVALGSKYTLW